MSLLMMLRCIRLLHLLLLILLILLLRSACILWLVVVPSIHRSGINGIMLLSGTLLGTKVLVLVCVGDAFGLRGGYAQGAGFAVAAGGAVAAQ